MRSFIASALPLVLLASQAQAGVTVYTGVPSTSTSSDAASATFYQGLPAYDPLTLQAPDPPQPPVTSYGLTVPPTEQALTDTGRTLSVKQKGNFLGFSIELSVAASILGTSAANLKVPFLNYLANIRNRAGQGAIVRVGGNTQESSTLYPDGTEDGEMIEKIKEEGASVTSTPTINYSPELFYAMANISAITDTEWFFGLPFNQSDVDNQIPNIPEIAQYAQQILGSKLLGLQLGNEPDLYSDHNKRPAGYTPANYNSEFQTIKQDILKDARLEQQQFLVGPSICCEVEGFELDDVLSAGWLTDNLDQIAMVAVQHYPENNCGINGRVVDSQEVFPTYLNHTSAVSLVQPYLDGTNQVLAAGKNIMMMEYGTASCGGFPGVSDSFGAALWTVDYALQMAAQNFTSALMHIGGQNVYYNAFTPPPTNLSRIGYQWTTGSVYYPTLFIAEAFGSSNNSQVVDLQADNDNIYHPAYAIYENGAPSRLALLNFVSDASGASDLSVTIDFNGTALPRGTVDVRYLSAASVSEKYEIYWANQTTRTSFASDGRLYGDVETVSIQCDTGANTCVIPLKAPSAAVVFLTDSALSESTNADSATATFATSVINVGSATIDSGALSTGNGMAGQPSLGSNSKGSVSSGQKVTAGLWAVGWTVLVSSLTLGVWGIRR